MTLTSGSRLGPYEILGAVALAGYDRSPRSPHAGETLLVSLYWEALRPLPAQYHSFVHLLDAQGNILNQWQGPVPEAELRAAIEAAMNEWP